MKLTILVIVALVIMFAITIGVVWNTISGFGGMDLSAHGWAAFALGGVLTLALSGGLFFLTFYSARKGYDDIDRPEDGASDS